MAVVREMIERNEFRLDWIHNKHQFADVLAKTGASSALLSDVLKEGKIRRLKF